MVRLTATHLLIVWAGTLAHALQLSIPSETVGIQTQVPITWTLEPGDPFPFSIVQQDLTTSAVVSMLPVLTRTDEAATSGVAGFTFQAAGQFLLVPVLQLQPSRTLTPISAGKQIGVVNSSSSVVPPRQSGSSSSQRPPQQPFSSSQPPPPPPPPTSTPPPETPTSAPPSETIPPPPPSSTVQLPPVNFATSLSVSSLIILTATNSMSFDFNTASFLSVSAVPTAAAATSTSTSNAKRLTIAFSVVGSIIGILLLVLFLLHHQRRRANRRRLEKWADTWNNGKKERDGGDWNANSGLGSTRSSFVVGGTGGDVDDVEMEGDVIAIEPKAPTTATAANPTSATIPTPTFAFYQPPAETHIRNQSSGYSRAVPPLSIPRTQLTPPSPSQPSATSYDTLSPYSNVPSSASVWSPATGMYSPGSFTTAMSSQSNTTHSNGNVYTPTSASHFQNQHLLSPTTPRSYSTTPTTPTPTTPTSTSTRSRKQQEVAEIQAQRKLVREEQVERRARGQPAAPTDADRDSWSAILGDEPLPRYVSPHASVRVLQ